MPIPLDGETRCGLNIYAREVDAFSAEMVRETEKFARGASKSLRLAVRIAHLAESRENLKAAMSRRRKSAEDPLRGLIRRVKLRP